MCVFRGHPSALCSPAGEPDLLIAFLPPKAVGLAPGQCSLCPGSPWPEPRPVRPVRWREVRLLPGGKWALPPAPGPWRPDGPGQPCAQQGGTPRLPFPDRERLTCPICMALWASPVPLSLSGSGRGRAVGHQPQGAVLTGQIHPERPALSQLSSAARKGEPFTAPTPTALPPPIARPPPNHASLFQSGERFPLSYKDPWVPNADAKVDVWMPGWKDGQEGAPPTGPSHLSQTPGCPLCGPRGVCTEA